jgi:hypothetical protein
MVVVPPPTTAKESTMKKTYNDFFENLYSCLDFGLPTKSVKMLNIENENMKFSMELTEDVMKQMVGRFVEVFGVKAVIQTAIESDTEK